MCFLEYIRCFRFANKSSGFGPLAQQATSSPQQNSPFGQTSAFGGGGNSAFGQATKSPFAANVAASQPAPSAFGGGFSVFVFVYFDVC